MEEPAKKEEPFDWGQLAAILAGAGLLGTAGYKGAKKFVKNIDANRDPQELFDRKYGRVHEKAKQIWESNPQMRPDVMASIFKDLKAKEDEIFEKSTEAAAKSLGAIGSIPAAGVGAWVGNEAYEDPFDTAAIVGSTLAGNAIAKKIAKKATSSKSKALSTKVRNKPMTEDEIANRDTALTVLPAMLGGGSGLAIGNLLAAYADPFEKKEE